jgi:hypothetical protein
MPGKVTATLVDVRDVQGVNYWIDSIMRNHEQLHGAANVAGIGGGYKPVTVGSIV